MDTNYIFLYLYFFLMWIFWPFAPVSGYSVPTLFADYFNNWSKFSTRTCSAPAGPLSPTRRTRNPCSPSTRWLPQVPARVLPTGPGAVGVLFGFCWVLMPSGLLIENLGIYDDIDADVLRNYQEFALVNILYLALKESSTSEQSARMTAMDSASKNACKATPLEWLN